MILNTFGIHRNIYCFLNTAMVSIIDNSLFPGTKHSFLMIQYKCIQEETFNLWKITHEILNCWEFKKCGGEKVVDLVACLAVIEISLGGLVELVGIRGTIGKGTIIIIKSKKGGNMHFLLSFLISFLIMLFAFSSHVLAAATAEGVALNTFAGCDDASLDITFTSVNAHRELGQATLEDGTILKSFEQSTNLDNFSGTYIGYGISIPLQPDNTVIGSYAYVGETPPSTSDTAEFFMLYECTTREVILSCFGGYGTCPQTAADALQPDALTLLKPNGGETIASGSEYNIWWGSPPEVVSFTLRYSVDNGVTWEEIATKVPGNSYIWKVPTPLGNKKQSLVKVIGYNADGVKVGSDKSDNPFTIEVLNITTPVAGATVPQGLPYIITWTANGTSSPPDQVVVKYTLNNGKTWKTAQGTLGASSFSWNVPAVSKPKNNAKVKVILKAGGVTVAKAVSGIFTVQ